jgi:hypothetical protein
MNRIELEAQCMAISHVVDTEVVARDPVKIPSFDFNTLYVWMVHPVHGADGEDYVRDDVTPALRGRLGPRHAEANSVKELARELGIDLHRRPPDQPEAQR